MMELAEGVEQPEQLSLSALAPISPPSGPPRILLVEDDVHALDALTELLEDMGYRVTPCANAEQALDRLVHASFDLLLTDVILPGIDGFELAARAGQIDPCPAIVLMSGYLPKGGELRDEWLFLRKPLDIAGLAQLLEQRLSGGKPAAEVSLDETGSVPLRRHGGTDEGGGSERA